MEGGISTLKFFIIVIIEIDIIQWLDNAHIWSVHYKGILGHSENSWDWVKGKHHITKLHTY